MGRKRPRRVQFDIGRQTETRSGDFDELFVAEGSAAHASRLQLREVRLTAITPDPDQPRRSFSDESLRELAESIEQDGVIQPIELVQVDVNQYRIVHGERRWRAASMAGLTTIPAIVRRRDYDEVTRFVRQLVENMQREDLNDVDRAIGVRRLQRLMQEELNAQAEQGEGPWASKMSWSKVGRRLGYSRQRIHQLIKLLELPEPILLDVRAGEVSERDTRIYHRLEDDQQQVAVYQAWRSGELTSAEAKRTVDVLSSGRTGSARQAMVIVKTNQDRPTKRKQSRPISRLAKMRLQLAEIEVDDLTEEQSAAALDLLQRLEYDVQTLIERLIAANR